MPPENGKVQRGQVLVYSIIGCPHCVRAKNSLRQAGIQYVDVSLDMFSPEVQQEAVRLSGGKSSVPQIFFNEKYIGGNQELQELINNKEEWDKLVTYIEETEPTKDNPQPPDASLAKNEEAAGMLLKCEADEYALLIGQLKSEGVISSKSMGLFTKAKQGFTGKDFVKWMKETKEVDEAKAREIGQALLDQNFSHNIKQQQFKNDSTVYTLLEDTFSQALNASTYECAVGSATEVGEELRKLILKLYALFISPDGTAVGYRGMAKSKEFEVYEKLSAELQRVDVANITRNDKVAFFINIYNAMVIHATIKKGAATNLWARYKFFNCSYYIIAGELYSLQDIENGILRGNKKGVGMLRVPFQNGDPRKELALEKAEPLIHFALNCGAKSCPPIKTFSPKGLQEQLTTATVSFLESEENCSVDEKNGTVTLSEIFKWYRSDFGNSDLEVCEFLLKYVRDENKKTGLEKLLADKKVKLRYSKYDWGHNGKKD